MVDPITVSVLTHRFSAIVEEMGEAMLRTAYSQILNSSRDFSTAICDAQARLVAQADHLNVAVASDGIADADHGIGEVDEPSAGAGQLHLSHNFHDRTDIAGRMGKTTRPPKRRIAR